MMPAGCRWPSCVCDAAECPCGLGIRRDCPSGSWCDECSRGSGDDIAAVRVRFKDGLEGWIPIDALFRSRDEVAR